MDKHVTVLAALKIGFGAFGIIIATIALIATVGGGIISQDSEAIFVTSIVGCSVFAFITLLSLPGVIVGIALLKRRPWARILMLILVCIDLLSIPVGTAIGIYGIWVLTKDETAKLFTAASGQELVTRASSP